MTKNKITALVIGVVLVLGGLVWWGLKEEGTKEVLDQSVTTYFFGEECPHCRNIRKFLDENKIEEKYSFVKREVWHDATNARLMRDAANVCGLKPDGIGVPFVFSESKCYIGEPDVMNFFKQKAGL